ARTLAGPGLRAALDERRRGFPEAVLTGERGPLVVGRAPGVAAALRRLLDAVAANLLARLDAYLASDDFRAAALRWADALIGEFGDQPIADVLTPEREAALAERADARLAQLGRGEGFERTAREYRDRAAGPRP